MEDDLPYGRQMRVYHISRRKRKITQMVGLFPTINPYFVYNINISLKSVFEIHGANLPHYHCQLTPLVGHIK
ncbi:hypothetical protein OUZ56_011947 [Daphnia magna]|uniref:Uncharacterized protein n=1 Tax=Daphnia magna TaxID=35525 RepID=A0ABQ9Z1T4_9CRUS|nr:hypothetical protein OUZ56_011947 [Daphnia magna]